MTRHFPLVPGGGGSPGGQTIILPPIAPPPGAGGSAAPGCACADLALVWAEGPTHTSLSITIARMPAVLVADGTICPGSTWTFDLDWSEDPGTIPTIAQVAATAWTITGDTLGTLIVTGHADCGGTTSTLPDMTLVIAPPSEDITNDTYWAGDQYLTYGDPPGFSGGYSWSGTEWTPPADGVISDTYKCGLASTTAGQTLLNGLAASTLVIVASPQSTITQGTDTGAGAPDWLHVGLSSALDAATEFPITTGTVFTAGTDYTFHIPISGITWDDTTDVICFSTTAVDDATTVFQPNSYWTIKSIAAG